MAGDKIGLSTPQCYNWHRINTRKKVYSSWVHGTLLFIFHGFLAIALLAEVKAVTGEKDDE
jgi:hypothetical protein